MFFFFQSQSSLPAVFSAALNLVHVLSRMTERGEKEMVLENEFLYVSFETVLASDVRDTTIVRDRVKLDIGALEESFIDVCNSTEVLIKVVSFTS